MITLDSLIPKIGLKSRLCISNAVKMQTNMKHFKFSSVLQYFTGNMLIHMLPKTVLRDFIPNNDSNVYFLWSYIKTLYLYSYPFNFT